MIRRTTTALAIAAAIGTVAAPSAALADGGHGHGAAHGAGAVRPAPAGGDNGGDGYGYDKEVFEARLKPVKVNKSTAHGSAKIALDGDTARITVKVDGVLAKAPHAQHIHFGGEGRCPTAAEAGEHNGEKSLSTSDGHPAYGGIGTSLTTSGDTSPSSGLAVDRFPTPDGDSYTYERTFDLTADVADAVRDGNAVVVVHGFDYNRSGGYDDALGASELDPSLPMEATSPAACGALK
jgi:hypothetical protein